MRIRVRSGVRAALITTMPALAVLGMAAEAQTIEEKVKVAPGLYQIVYSPSSNTVYVASVGERGADNAQIIELDSDTLESKDHLELPMPLYGLGINEKTQTLYGTDTRAGNVAAIDLETNEIVATIGNSDGAHLREVVVDEEANRIYISAVGRGDDAADEVWVIDGATNSLSHKIEVDTEQMTGIALDATGNRVFGTGMGADEIVVVDLATRETVERWPAGGERPTNAFYDEATGRLFVTNQGSGTLTVLDADDGTLIESVDTGAGALDVKFDADDNRIYVSNRQAGTVSVVDGETYEIVAQLETGTLPQTIAIDYAGDRVYVSNKARGLGRNAPPDAVPPEDPNGDTVVLIRQ